MDGLREQMVSSACDKKTMPEEKKKKSREPEHVSVDVCFLSE